MSNTEYYNLYTNNDNSEKLKTWIDNVAGTTNSNMTKIDAALHEIQQRVDGVTSLTFVQHKTDMTDTSLVYVCMDDGNWYYYSNNQWVSGGQYGGVPVDSTLSKTGEAADAKATGEAVNELKSVFNANIKELYDLLMPVGFSWEIGGITGDGDEYAYLNQIRTDFVPVGSSIQFSFAGVEESGRISYAHWYDSDKNWISRSALTNTNRSSVTPVNNAIYVRFTYGFTNADGRTVEGYGFNNLVADFSLTESKSLRTDSFTKRETPNDTTAFSFLRENGTYAIPSTIMANITDKPNGVTNARSGALLNYVDVPVVNLITQKLITDTENEYTRIINKNTGAVYNAWTQSVMVGLIDKVLTGRWLTSSTTLSSYRTMGVYGFTLSQFDAMTDKPSDCNPNVNHTLFVYDSTYSNNNYTIQQIFEPYGAKWERSLKTSDGTILVDWRRIDGSIGNVLYGKKLVTAGDSYTQASFSGEYAEYNGKNFGYYIAQRNNMTLVNSGISGSTMTSGTGSSNPFSTNRYSNIPTDTDYLTIWFGINDSGLDLPVGTIDDSTNETFYGAWNTVLGYYLTNYPFMKVLIIVSTGIKLAYREAVINSAKKWGYPYMDWVGDFSIPAFFDRTDISNEAKDLRRDAFGWNGPVQYHPNPQWHIYESSIIEAKLRSI